MSRKVRVWYIAESALFTYSPSDRGRKEMRKWWKVFFRTGPCLVSSMRSLISISEIAKLNCFDYFKYLKFVTYNSFFFWKMEKKHFSTCKTHERHGSGVIIYFTIQQQHEVSFITPQFTSTDTKNEHLTVNLLDSMVKQSHKSSRHPPPLFPQLKWGAVLQI